MRRLAQLTRAALMVAAAALPACGPSSTPPDGNVHGLDDPAGLHDIAVGATLPGLVFDGVSASGEPTTIHTRDFHDPTDDGLLLIMVSGGLWCGTCRWTAGATGALFEPSIEERVRRFDVVVGDRDNAPADADAAADWQRLFDDAGIAVGADPDHRFGALFDGPAALPIAVIVDPTTMIVTDALSRPRRHELAHVLRNALDDGDAPLEPPPLVDGLFDADEWALLKTTTPPGAPPADPTNAVADDSMAAILGEALFFDPGLSPSGDVACATCHQPEHELYDSRPVAKGVGIGRRRAPSVALAAHGRWQFWDGRADTLWSQALGPLEDPNEHGSSRVHVARRTLTHHADAYALAFPDAPILDTTSWPEDGLPGQPAYDALPEAERDAITGVFVRAGKAIAAYERTLRVAPNALDAYLAGNVDALDDEQKYGLSLFVSLGCQQCHWGPRLTDDAFHRVGIHDPDTPADPGRLEGLDAWRDAEFGAATRWSDAPMDIITSVAVTERLRGQFKTPALRGVAHAPFFDHAGTHPDLGSLMERYGWPDPELEREPWMTPFGETAQWGLLPLLRALTAEVVTTRRRSLP